MDFFFLPKSLLRSVSSCLEPWQVSELWLPPCSRQDKALMVQWGLGLPGRGLRNNNVVESRKDGLGSVLGGPNPAGSVQGCRTQHGNRQLCFTLGRAPENLKFPWTSDLLLSRFEGTRQVARDALKAESFSESVIVILSWKDKSSCLCRVLKMKQNTNRQTWWSINEFSDSKYAI